MKKRKKIIITLWITAILTTIILIKIIPKENNIKYSCESYEGLLVECSSEYEPVCWKNNKTYDNSCMACYIWRQKYYTEWECWKSQKISIIQLLINQLKNQWL